MKFVHKFKYLASCLSFIKLLSISALFYFIWITSSNSQRPQPVPTPPETRVGGTRGECLLVPLVPDNLGVLNTISATPYYWVYAIRFKEENSSAEYQVSVEHSDLATFEVIPDSDILKKDNAPKFIGFKIPIRNQSIGNTKNALELNQQYKFTRRCVLVGNPPGFGVENIINHIPNTIAATNLTFRQKFDLFRNSNLWLDATNLLFSQESCSNSKEASVLFEELMNKTIIASEEYKKYDYVRQSVSQFKANLEQMCKK